MRREWLREGENERERSIERTTEVCKDRGKKSERYQIDPQDISDTPFIIWKQWKTQQITREQLNDERSMNKCIKG